MKTDDFCHEYAAARKAWLGHTFASLNPMQLQAVLKTEGPVLILAGAGSGKTTVLINRIANLLRFGSASDSEELPANASPEGLEALRRFDPAAEPYAVLDPVPPWRILAITFTNKAADELKNRLENMLGPASRDIWACTFHAACLRILRRDAESLGYSSGFGIYDTGDVQSLMKRILKDMNLDEKVYVPRQILSEISRAKDAAVLPEEYANDARKQHDSRRMKIAEIYAEYTRRLFAANAMDFDDLILNTVLLLQRFPDLLAYWQNRFSYIMVDEYQDTNHLQYLLISLLAGQHRNLCVVGDDDQSIYAFRGATVENILSFEKQYPGCRTVRLEQNYRSTEQILEAANRVIRNNRSRKSKELWTALGRGDPVELVQARDETDEAYSIASSILARHSQGMQWRDHAILYRMNAQSNTLEFALKNAGIPYRVIGGARFFDRAEIKDVLSYLAVVADPQDELRLTRILNVPPRGIGDKSVETARSIARETGLSLFEVMEHADDYPELSRPALRMRQFTALIRALQEDAGDAERLYDRLLEKSGYLHMLETAKDERDRDRADNVRELKTSILNYQRQTDDLSLVGYLASIALYTDLDSLDADADCVVLMTIHSAKGLEFPVVYVIGMEDGIFPGQRAIGEQSEIEEERRLCYVAFTRAKRHLVLTHTRQRMIFGRTASYKPSRFLLEAALMDEDGPDGRGESRSVPWSDGGGRSSSYGVHRYGHGDRTGQRSGSGVRSSYGASPLTKPANKTQEPSLPKLEAGDQVRHKSFGEGTVVKLTPMGNDFLLEIEFAEVGSKKLMLKAAGRFLEKL